jgi:hypothetical protein
MQIPIIAAALACGLVLTACGAEEPATGDRRTEAREAMLAFAKCMRDQGIDMPDPQFDGGRVMQRGPDQRVSPEKMRRADEACRKYREEIEPPELSPEQQQEMKDGALAHAKCMREHGLENFPDPTFDENGGAQIRIGPGTGLDPDDPDFKAAEEACRDELPDLEEDSP